MESQTYEKVCEFEMIPTYQIFYNEESMFGIYAFCTKDQIPQFSPYNDNKFDDSGDKEYVASKLVGEVQQLYIGTKYNVKATCIYSQKYHEYQYKPISVVADVPKTQTDQLMFLKTQAKESIAESLLAEYPNIIEDVMAGKCKTIDTSMIKGLGNKTWAKLREKIINNYVISEVVVMLQPHGITFNMIKKLVEAEPDPEKLKYKINTNPYILTKIRGLGFKKVDDIALKIRPGTKIIISGDHMQLPPIGYGNIFSDLLKMDELDSVQLTKPMRQAEKSGILSDARKVRRAISPIEDFSAKQVHGELHDMFYIFRNNRENIFNLVVKQFMTCVKQDGMDNVVVISPRKSGCINSTEELNVAIQKELYKNKSNARFATYGKTKKFYVGDKVLQTSNDYERNTFNGDIGYITGIDYDKKVVHAMMNPDMDKKMIEYSFAQLGQLQLAYALTTHKLQGSAAQTVIGIIDNTHYKLLDNCMLYTMLTRAKKRFALLAEPEAFKRCIVTNHNKRRTWLSLQS